MCGPDGEYDAFRNEGRWGGFKFKVENVDVGEGRLEALGEGRADFQLNKFIVAWSRRFPVRDVGWEYMVLKSGLPRLFFN